MPVVILIVVIIALVIIVNCVKIVPQAHAVVVERLGDVYKRQIPIRTIFQMLPLVQSLTRYTPDMISVRLYRYG